MASQAADDRVRDPAAVRGHRSRIEPGAMVADVPADGVVLDLDEDRDLGRSRMPGRVQGGLPHRGDQGANVLVEVGVPDHDRFDLHLLITLDATGHGVDRVTQPRTGKGWRAPVEPRPQLTLLGARQAGHLTRGRGALDEGERLEHRVVEVRGHLSPLLGPHPRVALLDQLARDAPYPWPTDQRQPADRHERRQQRAAHRAERRVGGQEDDHRAHDQEAANRQARK